MRILYSFLFVFAFIIAQAQPGTIGSWNSYLSYSNNKCLTLAGNTLYVGGISGLFSINTETREIHKFNTVQGLSELNVVVVKYDAADKALFVGYNSTNIDILFQYGESTSLPTDFEKVNMSDINRKVIVGTKELHDVYFDSHLAYISTSFGIVVYDMQKREVKDSYLNFGPHATVPNVYGVAINNNKIYASTNLGILQATLSPGVNLSADSSWILIKPGSGKSIVAFNNKVYAQVDTLLQVYDGTKWSYYNNDSTRKCTLVSFDIYNSNLLIARQDSFIVEDLTGNIQAIRETYAQMAVISNSNFWFIKQDYGLLSRSRNGGQAEFVSPMGPRNNDIFALNYNTKKMWVMGGGHTARLEPTYNNSQFYAIDNYYPAYYQGPNQNAFDTVRDCIVSATTKDGSRTYIGTFGYGVLEIVNNNLVNIYGTAAPAKFTMRALTSWGPKITGLAFDSKENLWAANFLSGDKPLYVKLPDGNWRNFTINNVLGTRDVLAKIVIDNNDIKWITTFESNGLIAFKENSLDDPNNVNVRLLNDQVGQGALASKDVLCVAVDNDGEVWVGTANGVSVFSNPGSIFDANASDSKTPFVKQGNVGVPLLQYANVTVIKVDGANRKWIGTNGGLWLFNADGSKVLNYFNTDNSPLFSNIILDLELNPETGELYIATDKGLLIYKTDAVKGGSEFGDVYAYPNPVRPGYTGLIAIKGLIDDCTVKITDIAGNLVFETISLGGQAIWDGNDFNGNRAHSGVYIVFASNKDGSKHYQTKIAIVN